MNLVISANEMKSLQKLGFEVSGHRAALSFSEGGSCSLEKTSSGWIVKSLYIYEDIQESTHQVEELDQALRILGLL